MTKPVDLARARFEWRDRWYRHEIGDADLYDALRLCDEIERLRAENAACRGNDLAGDPSKWPHAAQIEGLGMQVAAMRPVVEAAVAFAPCRPDVRGYLLALSNLLAAVAAYEAAQEKPHED